MSGRLTTHVLDTAAGRPAAGVPVTLSREGTTVAHAVTNADGRTDAPLLEGETFLPGVYELLFDVRGYFASTPGFLDEVPVLIVLQPEKTFALKKGLNWKARSDEVVVVYDIRPAP